MKRLVSATLALSLLGGTAAIAGPYDSGGQGYYGNQGYNGYGNQSYSGSYGNQYRGYSYRGQGNNGGGALVAGVGILALAAILASQHRRNQYHQGWYNRDRRGYGYDNSYNRGYGNQFGDRYNGYGDSNRRW